MNNKHKTKGKNRDFLESGLLLSKAKKRLLGSFEKDTSWIRRSPYTNVDLVIPTLKNY